MNDRPLAGPATGARGADAGLSLVEVLVSLAIFAVIGVAGLAILNTVSRTGALTEGRIERLADVDRAFLIIRRDLMQIAPGPVTLADDTLAFRRGSGPGVAGDTVALAFGLAEGALVRRIGQPGSDPVPQRLLADTSSIRWRLLDAARTWHRVWPPVGGDASARPLAAELTLDIAGDTGTPPLVVTRLFPLPAGQGR